MIVADLGPSETKFPVVLIGTGFGSMFFVHRLLQLRPDISVLMIERGAFRTWETQLAEGYNSPVSPHDTFTETGERKRWNFTIAYGGGTNCWGATTPRLHPNDFRLKSLYGRGQDWPISYDELEPYYGMAEEIMDISGPDDIHVVTPRSRPYPQPPHKLTSADRVMKRAQPELHFALPTARARVANAQRPQCCASFVCEHCPVGAKFTALNGMSHITDHPNVRVLVDAEVTEVERSGGSTISAVRFRHAGRERRVDCELCVLGANAIHSPAILLRSGIDHPLLGRGLNEQMGFTVEALLDGLDNLDGSTFRTGANYSLYDGPFRAEHGAAFIQFENRFPLGLRPEFGRWRQLASVVIAVEQEVQDESYVSIDNNGGVVVHSAGGSPYGLLAIERSLARLPEVLAPLPVESITFKGDRADLPRQTLSHLQGTLRMGASRSDSVVDRAQVHHDIRNLIVVGTSVMPTCPPPEPSLTAAALSLRAADIAFS